MEGCIVQGCPSVYIGIVHRIAGFQRLPHEIGAALGGGDHEASFARFLIDCEFLNS